MITFHNATDADGHIIHIDEVTRDNRAEHYYCVGCGEEMSAVLGDKREHHFRHKEAHCNWESYLHKLAKKLIKDKFESSETFPVVFQREVPCTENCSCFLYQKEYCVKNNVKIPCDLKKWDGKQLYDQCREEVCYDGFRPDLLLSCALRPERAPIFIEIYKTHSSEKKKTSSSHKIIETKKLVSENDIYDILKRGFVEGDNCTTYNFSPQLPTVRKDDVPIDRFILFNNGAAKVIRAIDYELYCSEIHLKKFPHSIIELNMKSGGIDIWGDHFLNKTLDSYQMGLVYLLRKGMTIKNCILCEYYKYNDSYSHYMCVLYKTLHLSSCFPLQSDANKCSRFMVNQQLIQNAPDNIEDLFSKV